MNKKFAVFDIDGTLFRDALYHDVVDELARENKLGEASWQEITTAYKSWKNREHPEAFWDYVNASIKHFEGSVGKLTKDDFLNAAKRVFDDKKDHIYTYPKQLLNRLKSEGYFIIAISGSYQEIVDWFAKYHSIDIAVGSQYLYKNNIFSGTVSLSHHKKDEILSKLIEAHNLTKTDSYAVGDTHSDISLLEMVDNPIAFNPNQQLKQHAHKSGWTIVVERKNVIYELRSQDGTYILD